MDTQWVRRYRKNGHFFSDHCVIYTGLIAHKQKFLFYSINSTYFSKLNWIVNPKKKTVIFYSLLCRSKSYAFLFKSQIEEIIKKNLFKKVQRV